MKSKSVEQAIRASRKSKQKEQAHLWEVHEAIGPDSIPARVNNPHERGLARWLATEPAPADSPKIITRARSASRA